MKREDLKKLELSDEAIEAIMALHGKGVEANKTAAETALAEAEALKTQLAEANTTIEGFKKLDVDGIKQAADEWKAKAETAQTEAAEQMAKLKFNHALDGALTGAKAKNAKAVQALLDREALKLQEDGSILGLNEQLEKIKSENDYLFESDGDDPKIVAGSKNKSVLTDAMVVAAREAAGLKTE